MAVISVNPLNLSYKQFEAAPTPVLITFSALKQENIYFENVPSWLDISNITKVNATTSTALFTVRTFNANTLTEGDYAAQVQVRSYEIDQSPELTLNDGTLNVNLSFTESVVLEASPNNLEFTFAIGGTAPSGKLISITSENNWTVTSSAAWIVSSTTSGTGNGSFNVSVDTSGLGAGTHQGTVTIDDGTNTEVVNISLLVSDGNTGTDYLYVAPNEVEFLKNQGSVFSPTKDISLNSSAAWTATSSQSWLQLSKSSGGTGTDIITASLNTAALQVGFYTAEIEVVSGNFLRKVYVSLTLNQSIVNAPDSGGMYYAEDDEQLELTSENSNSYLQSDVSATTKDSNLVYSKKTTFHKGKASLNIGEEVVDLIDSVPIPEDLSTRILELIQPVVLNFTAYERDYFTSATLETISRNTLRFLNGETPETAGKLCHLPSVIRVSNKAVIAISVFAVTPPASIVITGSVSQTIAANTTVNDYVYTALVNLEELNLKPFDKINIAFGGVSVDVEIDEASIESIMLGFENQWQLPELFEMKGSFQEDETAGYSTQTLQVGKTLHERIYDATPGAVFSLYTGWMNSDEEVEWLLKILDSKRMFLYTDSGRVEVIPTFKSLNKYKTRLHQKNYKLTFKKAIV